MRFSPVAIPVAVAACLLLGGCASIQGTTQKIKVDSSPEGADVYVGVSSSKTGGTIVKRSKVGVTPIEVVGSRKDGVIQVGKAGYQWQEVPLHGSMNPWVWADIALLSPLSTSIDTSTGASNQYDPSQYMVTLTPVSPAAN